MKTNYFKMAFVGLFAVVALCSCSKDEDDNSSSDNGGNGEIQNNTLTVSIENGASYSEKIDFVKVMCDGITLASAPYNDGNFTLNLPPSVSDQYLEALFDEIPQGITLSNPDVKGAYALLIAYKSDAETGFLYLEAGGWEGEGLIYANGDVSIAGSYTETEDGETYTFRFNNCNLKKGWNTRYVKTVQKGDNSYESEFTTQVSEEAKWYFFDFTSFSASVALQKQAPLLLPAKQKFGFIK
jgi:hypothetical protein